MRKIIELIIVLIMAIWLAGCGGTIPNATYTAYASITASPQPSITLSPSPKPSETATGSPTASATRTARTRPTRTATSRPTRIPTLTPPVTLAPEQAEEAIRTLLREPVDCPAPCFWGIVPGRTTLGEAANIFTRLGLRTNYINTLDNKDFYDINNEFDSGLSISPNLTVQNGIVKNLSVDINPEKSKGLGVPRE